MTNAERFITLLGTIIVALGIIMAGGVRIFKVLWDIRGAWDKTNNALHETNGELTHLVEDVRELVGNKERDHARIDKRQDRLEARIERHEEWHSNH